MGSATERTSYNAALTLSPQLVSGRFALRLMWLYPWQRLGRYADTAEGTGMPSSAS